MKSILTLLTAFVLLVSSFAFISCKGCDEKETEPADGNSTASDTKTSGNKTDPGGTTVSDGDSISGGDLVDTVVTVEGSSFGYPDGSSSSGDGSASVSASAKDSGGGNSRSGGSPPPQALTSSDMVRVKIKEVLEGYVASGKQVAEDVLPDTSNAFTKAALESHNAFMAIDPGNPKAPKAEKEYIDIIRNVYCKRLICAVYLDYEYNKRFPRNDKAREDADDASKCLTKIMSRWEWFSTLYEAASDRIEDIKRNKKLAIDYDKLIKAWNELHNHNNNQLMRDADKQWEDLCKAVDADKNNRPENGKCREH
jgi:hypothetical protein